VREAKDDAERDQLWAGRRGAFGAVARLAPSFLVADCTVPRTRLPEALRTVATIADTYGFVHGNVFHAGDGNLHPLLFFDGQDPEQVERVHEAGREVMAACVALGGTITGEHGVGVEKMDALRMVFSEDDLDFQRSVRAAFDPAGLLNPGKIIPDRAEEAQSTAPGPTTTLGDELAPASESEAADMVRAAFGSRTPLLPVGGGRRADFGNLSPSAPVPLSSGKLCGVVDYDPSNLVVCVGAGTKLFELKDALAEHNQWLPLRPPLADGCTVGGVAALGACGPERLLHGAPRDRLLGLRFIDGRGRAIVAGGKVIKNVAGYDVTRLMAGSAGTLGFLTELTFRVSLRPEVCVAVESRGSLEACETAAAELLRTCLTPAFVWASAADSAWQLTVGFEGFGNTVRAQTDGLKAIAESAGLCVAQERDYAVCDSLHATVCDPLYVSEFLIRADLPLDVAMRFAAEALPGSGAYVDLGCGRVLAGLAELDGSRWDQLCRAAADADGQVILERAPHEFKRHNDVFGPTRPEWALMHRVKDAVDPHGVFAPGRLPGRK
jgi:FAD/FMN-containing dehydrogenase